MQHQYLLTLFVANLLPYKTFGPLTFQLNSSRQEEPFLKCDGIREIK